MRLGCLSGSWRVPKDCFKIEKMSGHFSNLLKSMFRSVGRGCFEVRMDLVSVV